MSGLPGSLRAQAVLIGEHRQDQLPDLVCGRRQADGVLVRLRHLAAVEPRHPGRFGQKRLRFREDRSVKEIETPYDLPGELQMRRLVLADRNVVRAISDDVGGLKERISEKSVSVEIPVDELCLLFLESRNAFEPGNGVTIDRRR